MIGAGRIAELAETLGRYGLALRGGFNFDPAEAAPATALLLVGNVGGAFWPHFAAWRKGRDAKLPDPLDRWTREIVGRIARESGASALYPSDRPYQPFQRWAMRAEGLRASPLGLLIHPRYGLWHAYRAALLFDAPLELEPTGEAPAHPCDSCVGKPCLRACPVDAHGPDGFDVDACARFQHGPGLHCRAKGCLDRNACPVGVEYRYPSQFQAFLADAFLRAHPA